MRHTALAAVVIVAMLTLAVLATAAAFTINNVIEARRDRERKELTEQTIAAMREIGREVKEKMPDLKLFNRKKPEGQQQHAPPATSNFRLVHRLGR